MRNRKGEVNGIPKLTLPRFFFFRSLQGSERLEQGIRDKS